MALATGVLTELARWEGQNEIGCEHADMSTRSIENTEAS